MAWTQQDVEKAFVEVRKKAMTDKNYRKLVLLDPHKAIAQVTGKDVPKSFSIKVVENEPAYAATFVLPEMESEELTDEALESVAGGVGGILGADVLVGACAAAVNFGGCAAYACAADAGVR